MCWTPVGRVLIWSIILQGALVVGALADPTRWGDGAGGGSAGSFELTYEKRLFEPGPTESYCERCANYLEVRLEMDEADLPSGADADVTALAVGYRRYFFPFRVAAERQAQHWRRNASAIFMGFGFGAYEVEPDNRRATELFAGWFGRAGLLVPLTHSCRRNEDGTKSFKSVYLDGILSATYSEIESPGANLDYASARIGVRFNFPSARDKARAAYLIERWEEAQRGDPSQQEIKDPCPGR